MEAEAGRLEHASSLRLATTAGLKLPGKEAFTPAQ